MHVYIAICKPSSRNRDLSKIYPFTIPSPTWPWQNYSKIWHLLAFENFIWNSLSHSHLQTVGFWDVEFEFWLDWTEGTSLHCISNAGSLELRAAKFLLILHPCLPILSVLHRYKTVIANSCTRLEGVPLAKNLAQNLAYALFCKWKSTGNGNQHLYIESDPHYDMLSPSSWPCCKTLNYTNIVFLINTAN